MAEPAKETQPQLKQLKVLFIMNNIAAFKDRFIYLHSKSVVIKGAAEPSGAIGIISKEVPDVVFISWDLKGINVKKFHDILSKTHGFICVVVAENFSPLRVSALLNSGLPNLLLPPVSGPAILEKVKVLIADREHFLHNYTRVSTEKVPVGGTWEKYAKKSGEPIWRMKFKDEEYFAQTQVKPELEKGGRRWKNLDDENTYQLIKGTKDPGYGEVQKKMDSAVGLMSSVSMKKVADRASGAPVKSDAALENPGFVKVVESKAIPAETKVSPNSKDPESVMAKSVEVALELSVERTSEVTKPIETVSKTTITMVQTGNFKGYLLGANGSDTPDQDLTKKVREHLARILSNRGEEVGGDVTIKTLELDNVPFQMWAEQNAEFIINSQHGDDDVAFAYFKSTTIMERPDGKTDIFAIDVDRGLAGNKIIYFDLYLHLPKNKKFVQYLRAGTMLTADMKSKILTQGISEAFIKNDQFHQYEEYSIKNEIDRSVAAFKSRMKKSE